MFKCAIKGFSNKALMVKMSTHRKPGHANKSGKPNKPGHANITGHANKPGKPNKPGPTKPQPHRNNDYRILIAYFPAGNDIMEHRRL